MPGKINLNQLDNETKKKLGLIQKGKNPDRDEIDRFAYKIIGLLSECSNRTIRTQSLKKALKLHLGTPKPKKEKE